MSGRIFCICALLAAATGCTSVTVRRRAVEVELLPRKFRLESGERVMLQTRVRREPVDAMVETRLLRPRDGYEKLAPLHHGRTFVFRAEDERGKGLYVATTYVLRDIAGPEGEKRRVTIGVAKRSFITGPVVADFFRLSLVPRDDPEGHIKDYLDRFVGLGGNLLVVHPLFDERVALCPCRAFTNFLLNDPLGILLEECGRRGVAVLVSLPWDLTVNLSHEERFESLSEVMIELHRLYSPRPAFCGFHIAQDGSTPAYSTYLRGAASLVKALDDGLIVSCSPKVNDPLVAGHVASVPEVDIVIPQPQVQSSWGRDGAARYPNRRAADFTRMFAEAGRTGGKLTLGTLPFFARARDGGAVRASDLADQTLATAVSTRLDGVALWSYHADVFCRMRDGDERAGALDKILDDFLAAYHAVQREIEPPTTAVYYPRNDDCAGGVTDSLWPTVDALRRLGVSHTVVVFVPPERESLPYYRPEDASRRQVRSMLVDHPVLLLSNVAALDGSSALTVKDYAASGGHLMLLGPGLAGGADFDTNSLLGVEGREEVRADKLLVRYDVGRLRDRDEIELPMKMELPCMKRSRGVPAVVVDDSHAVVQMAKTSEGWMFATPLCLWERESVLSGLVVEMLAEGERRATGHDVPRFLAPLPEDSQVAWWWRGDRLCLVVVNHTSLDFNGSLLLPREFRKNGCVVKRLDPQPAGKKEGIIKPEDAAKMISVRVPAHWYIYLAFDPPPSQ